MTILLIGCGRMGRAMAQGWRTGERVLVYDPMLDSAPEGTETIEALHDVDWNGEISVVLAVKPQSFASIAPALRPLAARGVLFVSIMAGITLRSLGAELGGTDRIVRVMPNTPAAIGKGIAGAVAGAGLLAGDSEVVERLLAPTGALLWLDDEGQLDVVTAVSGSGPAYFFRFAEALAGAGVEAGLPRSLAMRLARDTFIGAAALADADEVDLAELRHQVASPGGTTAAGLEQLNADGAIDQLLSSVVNAAAARSRDLAG